MAKYQTSYARYQSALWPGMIARPFEPTIMDRGKLYIPSGGKTVKPGHGVWYDAAQNAWRLPTSDAEELSVHGIVTAPHASIPVTGLTVGAGQNSDTAIEFANGDFIDVCVQGVIAVIAGGAVEYWDKVTFQNDDQKWDKYTHPQKSATYNRNENDIGTAYITCCNPVPVADGAVMEVRVNGTQRIL